MSLPPLVLPNPSLTPFVFLLLACRHLHPLASHLTPLQLYLVIAHDSPPSM